jgi:DNA-binding CsgD family transcriptional regulator
MSAIDYTRRAEQHRPTDLNALAREAQRLLRQGLTERDVGAALHLDPSSVRSLLAMHYTTKQEAS